MHFSYIDTETLDEHFVSLPEQGGSNLIIEDILAPGHLYTISDTDRGKIGVFKLELQAVSGNGKLTRAGVASATSMKDSINIASIATLRQMLIGLAVQFIQTTPTSYYNY